jgi:hypothetical protein
LASDDAGPVRPPDAQEPAVGGGVRLGSRPYVTLAEIGYLAVVAYVTIDFVLLVVTRSSAYSGAVLSIAVTSVLGFLISVAWFQLGRKEENSRFLAAGVAGAANAVLSLASQFVYGAITSSSSFIAIEVIGIVAVFVALFYFVMQIYAFFAAASVFRVRLFRYAGYMFVVGFLAGFALSEAGTAIEGLEQVGQGTSGGQNEVSLAAIGLGLLFSAATSLAAGIGFHRLRGTTSLAG